MRPDLPRDNEAARRALYGGDVFLLEPTAESAALVARTNEELDRELGATPREAQFRFGDEEFFRRMGRIRKRLYAEAFSHALVRDVIGALGFDPAAFAFDPVRVRTITHLGHENPRAAPIYYAHRDTWYSNPQGQITWWIPLHDVREEETFVFFPDCFARPVENDSGLFDHDSWVAEDPTRKIGWQNRNAGLEAAYPQLREAPAGRRVGFAARAGQILLFAGQHLHQTLPNTTGRTRFSADFRTVHLEDHRRGIGAPNVDNRSTGSALPAHVQPQ